MNNSQFYKVLTIAGFDGSGGAGCKQTSKLFLRSAVMEQPL